MRKSRHTKALKLASILLDREKPFRKNGEISWQNAYALEELFGVAKGSAFASVCAAVRNVSLQERPSPYVIYDFHEHALHIRSWDMTTRVVQLQDVVMKREAEEGPTNLERKPLD